MIPTSFAMENIVSSLVASELSTENWMLVTIFLYLFMQEVTKCGFVSWVDGEWLVQLQNALGKI
jgi:hypothetical protein